MQALVSIILPVYNSSLYLKDCIDSLLQQTYTHLEILAINDGSTDQSAAILQSYSDARLQCQNNEQNEGLVYTLNKGLALAKGKYIARMDADDIAVPERIALQVAYMEQNHSLALVAGCIHFINEQGLTTGHWQLDQMTTTPAAIQKAMLKENCIAHPSVLFRASIIKHYRYNSANKHCEDYGLWLALLADQHMLGKIAQPILLYRVHTSSITGKYNKKRNPFFINMQVKKRLLLHRLQERKWGKFESLLCAYLLRDAIMGMAKSIKKQLTA